MEKKRGYALVLTVHTKICLALSPPATPGYKHQMTSLKNSDISSTNNVEHIMCATQHTNEENVLLRSHLCKYIVYVYHTV